MDKQQWIKSQSQALNITNPNDLWSYLLTTQIEIENTTPQNNAPKLPTIEQAFSIVPDAEAFAISETRTYDRLLDAFRQGRMDWVQHNITTLIAGGIMSLTTAQAIGQLMAETELDPNWQPTVKVPMYVAAGFQSLSLEEVIDALL
jgi:hypothetical protein